MKTVDEKINEILEETVLKLKAVCSDCPAIESSVILLASIPEGEENMRNHCAVVGNRINLSTTVAMLASKNKSLSEILHMGLDAIPIAKLVDGVFEGD